MQFLDDQKNGFEELYGRTVDLKILVSGKLLDSYSERKMLTWHSDGIPENEIWVKIGGDHAEAAEATEIAETEEIPPPIQNRGFPRIRGKPSSLHDGSGDSCGVVGKSDEKQAML
ncbi:hypothetical protein PoB_002668000 [Plakobranchus ocellatus]|uniref:Uncharacterized protein n=1 Tax=Plakobranchus ocellatus TaxID=259542 RepID=A0AAV3ZWC3_9GAST|nr:hypothetical protein PoB_002668000 [Plakobranchus ocellatus]